MATRIVGSFVSPYVRKVLACMNLKQIAYEVDPITPFYGNDEFERLSPLRRIPVLVDGDFSISDSSVICAYLGSGLQLFIMGAVVAWMPSFLNRYYALPPDRAAVAAAVFVLLGGTGMIVCGALTDRASRHAPERKWTMAIAGLLLSAIAVQLVVNGILAIVDSR